MTKTVSKGQLHTYAYGTRLAGRPRLEPENRGSQRVRGHGLGHERPVVHAVLQQRLGGHTALGVRVCVFVCVCVYVSVRVSACRVVSRYYVPRCSIPVLHVHRIRQRQLHIHLSGWMDVHLP